jgi:peptide chain release factor 2
MVKDLRTRVETGDVNRVLEGDLDPFIKAYLMQRAAGTLGSAPQDDEDNG